MAKEIFLSYFAPTFVWAKANWAIVKILQVQMSFKTSSESERMEQRENGLMWNRKFAISFGFHFTVDNISQDIELAQMPWF